ncbi:MAG TPA: glucosaminidase domain-containing protein [Candidatus Krumholzibacteria bacterium]|nr:glucosaminidase domain-containing protein [Candidatus Krumholzibacteria bacterium]
MTRSAATVLFLVAGLAATAAGRAGAAVRPLAEAAPDTFRFANLPEIRDYFAAADYTLDHWRAGERSVPRYYLARVPSRWRKEVAPELPVHLKKRYFFFVYAPLVLEANEDILADRERLALLAGRRDRSAGDEAWLRDLARAYRLDPPADGTLADGMLAELMQRVDAVPTSLALAQAAVESGWSTSRFADLGNALFGQWTWGDDGITPQEQRGHLGDYKIKAFATPEQSIAAYMRNLNTHPSYADFRAEREQLRGGDEKLIGASLARALVSYSEKGEEYVHTLLSVIDVNGLEPADEAYLRDMKPVVLLPVGDGAD